MNIVPIAGTKYITVVSIQLDQSNGDNVTGMELSVDFLIRCSETTWYTVAKQFVLHIILYKRNGK